MPYPSPADRGISLKDVVSTLFIWSLLPLLLAFAIIKDLVTLLWHKYQRGIFYTVYLGFMLALLWYSPVMFLEAIVLCMLALFCLIGYDRRYWDK